MPSLKLIPILFLFLGLTNSLSAQTTDVLPITGTWINLAYQDVRNKYTNPQFLDNTDPVLWESKIKELSNIGIEYLIFMAVANEGKSYYPSRFMEPAYPTKRKSPVDAIMDAAGKYNMKVFLSTGWAKDQDDNLRDPEIKKLQLKIMNELAASYKTHEAFYGWYLPVEDCLCPILEEHAVQSVNDLCDHALKLTPGKKTLISPYGIFNSDFENPNYARQLSKLKVNIIAYQDEVGCKRESFPIIRLKENWKKLRAIHDKLNIELWANCELFTWEKEINDRRSALIPAAFPRVLSQLSIATAAGVNNIISFMTCGIWEDSQSEYLLGQPVWSAKVQADYCEWRNGSGRWAELEKSFNGKNEQMADPSMAIQASHKPLFDNKTATENSKDQKWVYFKTGYQEIILDQKESRDINQLIIRMLHYAPEKIGFPTKVYFSTSDDGISYSLKKIQEPDQFANKKHDAWIDMLIFNNISHKSRYIKIAFTVEAGMTGIDEIFVL